MMDWRWAYLVSSEEDGEMNVFRLMWSFARWIKPEFLVPRPLFATLAAVLLSLGCTLASAQKTNNTNAQQLNSTVAGQPNQQPPSRAYVNYLLALGMAGDGSRTEAMPLLKESLRLQPNHNPAAALAFELLTEQRANTPLRFIGHTGQINAAVYSEDGSKVLTASDDHTARIWDAHNGTTLTPILQHDDEVLSAAFSADGTLVVTGTGAGKVSLWNAFTGKALYAPFALSGEVVAVAFSPDGTTIAAGTGNGALCSWNVRSGKALYVPILYHQDVFAVTFSRDGTQLLVATGETSADLRDAHTGVRLARLRHKNAVYSAVYSTDGKKIVTASQDGHALEWDAASSTSAPFVLYHGAGVHSAVFSPDGLRIATASFDHTARIWDAKTGQPMTPRLQHPAPVGRVAFSPDGRLVASVSGDGTVRDWDATTGDALGLPIHCQDTGPHIAFSPNGLSLLIVDGESMRVVDLPPVDAAPEWLLRLLDFAATQQSYDSTRQPDVDGIHALHKEVVASTASDQWSTFGRWYFAEPASRPVSPWSQTSLKSYVDVLLANGDRSSLDYARSISKEHPSWLAKMPPDLANASPEKP